MDGSIFKPVEPRAHMPASALILHIARSWPNPRITVGELTAALGMRSYGLLIILFALPNLLPIYIPGLSPIFGIPLGLVCMQLALGYPAPRLPGFLARRSLRRSDLTAIAEQAQIWLQRIERFVKPRPSILTSKVSERIIGAYGALLALIVVVPLPLTNGPPSLACAIMAIGLMEEDSLTLAVGVLFGIAAAVLGLSIIGLVWWMILHGLQWLLGILS